MAVGGRGIECDRVALLRSFQSSLTRADGINDRGSIAISGFRIDADGVCRIGWVLKRATGEEVIAPVSGGSVFSINIHDVIVGSSQSNAVKWSPAIGPVVLSLGSSTPPFAVARAWSINDRNQAVGYTDRFNDDFSCLLGSDAKFWAADGTERPLPGLPGAPFIGASASTRRASSSVTRNLAERPAMNTIPRNGTPRSGTTGAPKISTS